MTNDNCLSLRPMKTLCLLWPFRTLSLSLTNQKYSSFDQWKLYPSKRTLYLKKMRALLLCLTTMKNLRLSYFLTTNEIMKTLSLWPIKNLDPILHKTFIKLLKFTSYSNIWTNISYDILIWQNPANFKYKWWGNTVMGLF